jgi:hypothetical protein
MVTGARKAPRRATTTRGRRLMQLFDLWLDEQKRRLREAVSHGLSKLALFAVIAVFVLMLVGVATARLVAGLSAALAAAWDGPAWTGDLAVGLALPLLALGLVLRWHGRASRRRELREAREAPVPDDEDA